MLKQPIYYEFNLDARTSPSKLIAISHVDDRYSEIIEVALMQNGRHIYAGGTTVIARMVLHRDKDYLLSDNVACSVNSNGNILIPFDNAVVKTSQGVVKIEVNITRDTNELTLQFPLWVSVNGSILDNAEVTPESRGTVPDLLREAAAQLSRVKDFATEDFVFENLDAALQGNPNTSPSLFVMQDAETENYKMVYMDSADDLHVLFDFALLPAVKGEKGDNGRGVTSFSLNNGILTANFDDRTSQTIGNVKGADGADGQDGADGKSAYDIAVENGFVGTESQWLNTLKGAPGATGPQGPAGSNYVLTDADRQAIAQIAMDGLNGNGVAY